MFEAFGINFTPTVTAGNILVMLALVLGSVVVAWIKTRPATMTAENEGSAINDAGHAQRRSEDRTEIHKIKNDLAIVMAEQRICAKALSVSQTLNQQQFFLNELLISEMEAQHPESTLVKRARQMFDLISKDLRDPNKSDALNTAEGAERDAKQTLASTKETRKEIERTEGDEKAAGG